MRTYWNKFFESWHGYITRSILNDMAVKCPEAAPPNISWNLCFLNWVQIAIQSCEIKVFWFFFWSSTVSLLWFRPSWSKPCGCYQREKLNSATKQCNDAWKQTATVPSSLRGQLSWRRHGSQPYVTVHQALNGACCNTMLRQSRIHLRRWDIGIPSSSSWPSESFDFHKALLVFLGEGRTKLLAKHSQSLVR